jgi:NAD(P)-dependent dehydrogenase (short-subunit alcohol dehydrogenase family)
MGRTILLTGVTGSIGEATAKQLVRTGHISLILAGRNPDNLETLKTELHKINSHNTIDTVLLDLANIESVRRAVGVIKEKYTDLTTIVNLAAVYTRHKQMNAGGFETMFATNYIGTFLFTFLLSQHYAPAKALTVITVSSSGLSKINFDNLNGERRFSSIANFSQSKTCEVLFAKKLARQFDGTASVSFCFDPGIVQSKSMNNMPLLIRAIGRIVGSAPDKPAQTLTQLILSPTGKDLNGKFINKNGSLITLSRYAEDNLVQDKLWKITQKLISANAS